MLKVAATLLSTAYELYWIVRRFLSLLFPKEQGNEEPGMLKGYLNTVITFHNPYLPFQEIVM